MVGRTFDRMDGRPDAVSLLSGSIFNWFRPAQRQMASFHMLFKNMTYGCSKKVTYGLLKKMAYAWFLAQESFGHDLDMLCSLSNLVIQKSSSHADSGVGKHFSKVVVLTFFRCLIVRETCPNIRIISRPNRDIMFS